ncbi:CobW-like GTP-binding protein [Acidicapsa acidisoli]|uniref:CobW-like GTP-binding protein n=1 Tax=Acidicapsa acidisoli TaxID=1615681 RepID=UPI0021E01FDB|nr:CobW-like GTP-binding protein [Acidicapsa acidisoli]
MSLTTVDARPWIIVVGGFLGAGKTTLLLAAARELKRRGVRSAVVMNDQGEALVDSEYASYASAQSIDGLRQGEVTGGCFCCRFSELIGVMEELRAFSPEIIFAEPVGSCTDISATTLHPLREYSDQYRLSPFTVLVDPERAREVLAGDADTNLKFLFEKQLQEADVVCFSKSDRNSVTPSLDVFGAGDVRRLSAKTGDGVAAWLDEMLSGRLSAGSRILDIDYEQYACAEAALVWLNLEAEVRPAVAVSPAALLGPLFDELDTKLSAGGIGIVHLKAIVRAESGFVKAAICANGQEPDVEGNLAASPAANHSLLMNLRALGAAPEVRKIVEECLGRIDGEIDDLRISCFHPAAPRPERRIVGMRSGL